jgi:lipopolysaccharide biosynthesis regulator YciM
MPLKRLLITLVGLAVLVSLFALFNLNQQLLTSPFQYTTQRSVPTWLVIVAVAVGFLFIPFLLNLIQDVKKLPTVWSTWRQSRSRKEVDQKYARAMEEINSGNERGGLDLLRAILDRDPEHMEALLAAGTLFRESGQIPRAIELHKRANRINEDDPRPLSCLAADYEVSADNERAMAILGELVSRHPRFALEPYRRMRALCIRQGSWEKAWSLQQRIRDLEKRAATEGSDGADYSRGIRYELALERKREGRGREAEQMLRRLVKEAPDFGPALLELGRFAATDGKETEALKLWQRGFAATGAPVFLQAVQDHHLTSEEPMKAIDILRDLARQGDHPLVCRLFLGRLYEKLEMIDQALDEFHGLEAELPGSPMVQHHLARLLDRRGKHQEASARYARLFDEWNPVMTEYRCRHCQAPAVEWRDRCESCGLWGCLAFPIKEILGSTDPGISQAPVYSAG